MHFFEAVNTTTQEPEGRTLYGRYLLILATHTKKYRLINSTTGKRKNMYILFLTVPLRAEKHQRFYQESVTSVFHHLSVPNNKSAGQARSQSLFQQSIMCTDVCTHM